MGTPRGRKSKKSAFNFTPKKVDMCSTDDSVTTHSSNLIFDQSGPLGLVNVANDCFFNSVAQALFALVPFRNHVREFDSQIPNEVNAVSSIKQLFRDMEARSINPLQTHDTLMSLYLFSPRTFFSR